MNTTAILKFTVMNKELTAAQVWEHLVSQVTLKPPFQDHGGPHGRESLHYIAHHLEPEDPILTYPLPPVGGYSIRHYTNDTLLREASQEEALKTNPYMLFNDFARLL